MNKKDFLEKHGFDEKDFINLKKYQETRERGEYDMVEYFILMENFNVNGGKRLATWLKNEDNYNELLELLEKGE